MSRKDEGNSSTTSKLGKILGTYIGVGLYLFPRMLKIRMRFKSFCGFSLAQHFCIIAKTLSFWNHQNILQNLDFWCYSEDYIEWDPLHNFFDQYGFKLKHQRSQKEIVGCALRSSDRVYTCLDGAMLWASLNMDKMDGRKGILVVHSSKKIEFRKMVKKRAKMCKECFKHIHKEQF